MLQEKAKELFNSFNNQNERIDFIEKKFKYYESLGYRLDWFRSSSCLSKDNITIVCNKMSLHEYKTVIEFDKYLLNKNNENTKTIN